MVWFRVFISNIGNNKRVESLLMCAFVSRSHDSLSSANTPFAGTAVELCALWLSSSLSLGFAYFFLFRSIHICFPPKLWILKNVLAILVKFQIKWRFIKMREWCVLKEREKIERKTWVHIHSRVCKQHLCFFRYRSIKCYPMAPKGGGGRAV